MVFLPFHLKVRCSQKPKAIHGAVIPFQWVKKIKSHLHICNQTSIQTSCKVWKGRKELYLAYLLEVLCNLLSQRLQSFEGMDTACTCPKRASMSCEVGEEESPFHRPMRVVRAFMYGGRSSLLKVQLWRIDRTHKPKLCRPGKDWIGVAVVVIISFLHVWNLWDNSSSKMHASLNSWGNGKKIRKKGGKKI